MGGATASASTPRGCLICFSGIDGAGKTTLAYHLAKSLSMGGVRFRYVYARFLPMLVRPIWAVSRIMLLRGQDIERDYAGYSAAKKTLLRKTLLRNLHQLSVLVDYFIQVLVKVTLPRLCGVNLVCDRYVYDTVVSDLAADLDLSPDRVARVIDLCFRVMPRPDLTFLLDVPESISLTRKSDILPPAYLTERRRAYAALLTAGAVVSLNGMLPLDQLKEQVVAIAQQRILCGLE